MERQKAVSGVAYDGDTAKIGLLKVPDKPGIAARVFTALAKESVNVDMVIQSIHGGKVADLSFTVSREDLPKAVEITKKLAKEMNAEGVVSDDNVAKVSIVGVGMISQPGVAAKMFQSLADAGINIEMISTSEIKVSCIVSKDKGKKAVKVLHKAFELHK